jgi:DNA-binding NarL/FixJ family response regulator
MTDLSASGLAPLTAHAHPRKCAMVVKIPTATELTQLTPTEKLVAEALITGASNAQGADDLSMSTGTFAAHVSSIGRKFQVTSRKGRAARAHAVLASGQVAPPAAPAVAPDFTHAEQRLLRALAEHPETHDIARAAGIPQADVRPQIRELVAKAGADNDTHLIGLGHAWGLLGAGGIGSSTAAAASDEPGGAES